MSILLRNRKFRLYPHSASLSLDVSFPVRKFHRLKRRKLTGNPSDPGFVVTSIGKMLEERRGREKSRGRSAIGSSSVRRVKELSRAEKAPVLILALIILLLARFALPRLESFHNILTRSRAAHLYG